MNWLTSFFLAIGFSITSFASELPNAKFLEANELYNSNLYDSALTHYEELIDSGYISFELFFNAGNAAYQNKIVGKSILYYEKAKKLDPSNQDVIHNLQLLNRLVLDKNPSAEKSKAYDRIMSVLSRSPNYWSWGAILTIFIGFACLLLYKLSIGRRNKKIGFFLGVFSILLSVICILLATVQYNYMNTKSNGIVLGSSVSLKNAPNSDAKTAFILHEGAKFEVKAAVIDWYEVIYSDGKIGWIASDQVELI